MTIYIIRHQEGDKHCNCLNKIGLEHCNNIFEKFKHEKPVNIFTCTPHINGKHVRPLQTASMLGSLLYRNVTLVTEDTLEKLPEITCNETNIIVWHHKYMQDLLQFYYPNQHFEWFSDNYTGALKIDKNCWRFDKDFLKPEKETRWSRFTNGIRSCLHVDLFSSGLWT